MDTHDFRKESRKPGDTRLRIKAKKTKGRLERPRDLLRRANSSFRVERRFIFTAMKNCVVGELLYGRFGEGRNEGGEKENGLLPGYVVPKGNSAAKGVNK